MFVIKTNKGKDLELENPAFLIGNGINYHDNYKFSWTQLLIDLLPENYFKNSNDGLDEIIEKILEKIKDDDSVLFNESIINKEETKKILPLIRNQLKKQEKLFDRNMDGLTYPEIAELALREKDAYINIFKSEVAEKTITNQTYFFSEKHNQIVQFAFNNNLPILTTNYDLSLLKAKNNKNEKIIDRENFHWIKNNRKEDKTYLSNAYFRPQQFTKNNIVLDVSKEFAIWHIHGVANPKSYSTSIKLTNKDYANTIARLTKSLKKMKENNCTPKWDDYYSWIKIIMTNDLIIAGLGLESSETDLRWLLVERYIYHKNLNAKEKNHKLPNTVYIYSNELPDGTKKYFEKLNIHIIKKDYDAVFDVSRYIINKD